MIDLDKKYRTRCGEKVKLIAINQVGSRYPVIGAREKEKGYWIPCSWTVEGYSFMGEPYNLREVLPMPEPQILVYNSLTGAKFLRGLDFSHINPHFRIFRLDFESERIVEIDREETSR